MACCCKCGTSPSAAACLGRCDLPRHKCLDRTESKRKGMVPKNMGWLYTAKDSPDFQLRCGWRPGHIFCPVLRKIEQHNCMKTSCSPSPCPSLVCSPCLPCPPFPCSPKPCRPVSCYRANCPNSPSPCQPLSPQAMIRVTRHGGQYTLKTTPADISNAPSGQFPLKYVMNVDDEAPKDAKFSVEAKYNDYHFDYTTSQSSFVLDFTPPVSCRPPKCQ